MSRKKGLIELFYNNRFAVVFSICAATILWIVMAVTNTINAPE